MQRGHIPCITCFGKRPQRRQRILWLLLMSYSLMIVFRSTLKERRNPRNLKQEELRKKEKNMENVKAKQHD